MAELNKHTTTPFDLVSFEAKDRHGQVIYHTNCMLSVLKNHYVVCLESVTDKTMF